MMEASERTFTIVNKLGLHARAAARLVQLANSFPCDVSVSRDGQTANAKSIMGVLMLAAAQGTQLVVRVEGEGSAEVLDSIGALIESGFGEDTG